MPKKTTILILILAAVTGILLFLAVSTGNQKMVTTPTPQPTKKPLVKTSKIFFNPQNIDLSSGTATPVTTVDLMIDTGENSISGVQAELQFDPKALVDVRLNPSIDESSFFGTGAIILFNEINQTDGRIHYAITVNPGQQTKRGIGKIATLSFQKSFNSAATSAISFLNKTMVTVLGEDESVLKEALPLNITLRQQAPIVTTPILPTTPPVQ